MAVDKRRASITVSGKKRNLGRFNTQEEAALRYNQEARLLYGVHAYLNPTEAPIERQAV